MAIFNSYVSLPEGKQTQGFRTFRTFIHVAAGVHWNWSWTAMSTRFGAATGVPSMRKTSRSAKSSFAQGPGSGWVSLGPMMNMAALENPWISENLYHDMNWYHAHGSYMFIFKELWWIMMDYDGLWWIMMDYDGLWWIMMDYPWIIQIYPGWSWINHGYFPKTLGLSLEVVASEEELLLEAPDPRYHGSGVFAPSQFAPGGDP